LELLECKFAKNSLTNEKLFSQTFVSILFDGESHQVVKITVIYGAVIIPRLTAQQGQEFNGAKGGDEQLSANRLKTRFSLQYPGLNSSIQVEIAVFRKKL
jgi:hypothetical protein